ncbi:MATE family efflux transporter [candidate division KSB1 bacterium]|nr:MATE family efflux transporter [candidate division KSB1 bacterium]
MPRPNTDTPSILSGAIGPALFRLSLPILWGMLFELLYQITDTLFLARIDTGDTAVIAGVGLVFPLFFLIVSVLHGLASGVATLVAIAIGADKRHEAETVLTSALALSIGAAVIVLTLFRIGTEPLLNILAGSRLSAAGLQHGRDYLYWLLPGFAFLFPAQILFSALQGEGLTHHIGKAMVSSTVLNIALDPLFIFTLGLGVRGAAMATSLAQFYLLVYVLIVFGRRRSSLHLHLKRRFIALAAVKRILELGIPQSLGFVALSASFMILNWFVGNVGEDALNAFTLTGRLDHLLLMPILALSTGLSILIGQSYGSGDRDRVAGAFRRGSSIIIGVVLGLSVLYIPLAPFVLRAFTDVDSVLAIASQQIRWITLPVGLGNAMGIAAGFAFQAVARPLKSLFAILLRLLLITVPVAWILARLFGPSMPSIWIAYGCGTLVGGALGFIGCYRLLHRLPEPDSPVAAELPMDPVRPLPERP